MKSKKIVFLGPAPPWRGGISSFATLLANEMRLHGHIVKMLSFIKQYPKLIFPGKEQSDPLMETYGLDIEPSFTPYLFHTWFNAVNNIKSFDPDVIIVSFWIPLMAPALGWICRKLQPTVKIVYLIHNIDFHEKWPLAGWFTRYALQSATHYLTLSEKTTVDLQHLIPRSRYSSIIKGFHPVYNNYHKDEQQMVNKSLHNILFFGLIKAYKGLDVLLKAFPKVLQCFPDAKLLIYGEVYGDDKIYRELISKITPVEAVTANFTFVPDTEISQVFRNSNVCVIPYKSATQSGVVAMAFAHDIPVIASDIGGLSETIKNGINGLLVPAEDVDALSEAIVRYFTENMQIALAENIRYYREQHSWSALAHIMEQSL